MRRPAARQLGLALERIIFVILDADEGCGELVGAIVSRCFLLGRLIVGPDDQRRSGLVDQDAVGLVNDREVMGALYGHLRLDVTALTQIHLLKRLAMRVAAKLKPLQLVAQEIEAQLLGRSVGDVACIRSPADRVALAGLNTADGQAEHLVDRPHPLRVAPGEVVVDRDDVHAFAGERVQERRHGRDQRLAFAGLQLGDTAIMNRDPSDDLHVELTLADRSLRGLAHQGVTPQAKGC